jgi:hypothetical protein
MKTQLLLAFATAASLQAAVIQFDLSPQGDAAIGLSPSNQVPPAATSTGFGNEISAGIVFDTTSSQLHLAVGYGSAAGFADLTGPATAIHIHGPAGPGTNAAVLVDLMPLNFTAANPTNGGVVVGSVSIPTNAVADLLAGLDYINIHTLAYTNGELRGQLVAVATTNAPPTITCPPPSTNNCDAPTELTILVSDPEGDALTVVWSVNGTPMQTNNVAATSPPAAANLTFSASLPVGTNAVGVEVSDSATNSTSCGSLVTVVDTTPPTITSVQASPDVLWPANHQMRLVRVTADVADDCSATTYKILSVTCNESADTRGSGKTSQNWQICGNHQVLLRAERSGKGSGRVYTLTVQATDASGNSSPTSTVTVTVPHDQGNGHSGNGGNGNSGNGNSNNGKGNKGNGHGKNK